jgi:hypothetical protein
VLSVKEECVPVRVCAGKSKALRCKGAKEEAREPKGGEFETQLRDRVVQCRGVQRCVVSERTLLESIWQSFCRAGMSSVRIKAVGELCELCVRN